MPKEYIECADFGRRVPVVVEEGKPAEFATLDMVSAKVGWTRDRGHVELAVVPCTEGAYNDLDARYMQLDREGLNRLIRALRKARDQAFGADA